MIHHEIYGPYNPVCQFIKHLKYDKVEHVLLLPLLPKSSVEEAQEDVQGPNHSSRGHRPPQHVHTTTWSGDGPTSVVVQFLLPGAAC